MLPREIVRSRRWIAASAALIVVSVLVGVWLATGDRGWAAFAVSGVALILVLAGGVMEAVISMRSGSSRWREAGFRVAYERFVVLPRAPLGLAVYAQVTIFVSFTIMSVRAARDTDFLLPAISVFNLLVAALIVRSAWRGSALELSPQGIESRMGVGHRLIPWEALAPGGPIRPSLTDFRLGLIASRPELVTKRGLTFWQGTRERPFLLLNTMVHPWFLADSIAWYVANPEERGAIGTEAGHARLLAALSADVPFIK